MAANQPVVLILGGSKRIGEQCAHIYASNGWSPFVADTNAKALTNIVDTLGDKVGTLKADPCTAIGLDNILSGVMDKFGQVNAVCHIPDIPEAKKFFDVKSDEFDDQILKPARSTTAAIRRFSLQMMEQMNKMDPAEAKKTNYSFVQIFGMGAQIFNPAKYTQNAAQSMALAASKSAAIDLAHERIRCNTIVAIRPRAENEEPWLKERTPLGRHSYAEEIAQTAFFLTSDGAANMTGQSVVLDGGRSILNGTYSPEAFEDD